MATAEKNDGSLSHRAKQLMFAIHLLGTSAPTSTTQLPATKQNQEQWQRHEHNQFNSCNDNDRCTPQRLSRIHQSALRWIRDTASVLCTTSKTTKLPQHTNISGQFQDFWTATCPVRILGGLMKDDDDVNELCGVFTTRIHQVATRMVLEYARVLVDQDSYAQACICGECQGV